LWYNEGTRYERLKLSYRANPNIFYEGENIMSLTKDTIVRPSRETIGERSTTHGLTGTPEHAVWKTMRMRCNNPNNKSYPNYGGRGIKICERWNNFENFLADMGKRPRKGLQVERIDNDGDYCPENCEWNTPKVQANNRRSNCMLTYDGRTQNISQWSEEVDIKRATLLQRFHSGWNAHDILTTPAIEIPKNHDADAVTFQGQTFTLAEWASKLGIKRSVLYKRIFTRQWSIEKAFTQPERRW